jgi:hypothetical protein
LNKYEVKQIVSHYLRAEYGIPKEAKIKVYLVCNEFREPEHPRMTISYVNRSIANEAANASVVVKDMTDVKVAEVACCGVVSFTARALFKHLKDWKHNGEE